MVVAIASTALIAGGAIAVAKTALGHPANGTTSASKSSRCITDPAPVSIEDAKLQLNFPVFAVTGDPDSALVLTQYAQGCGGARGLALNYRLKSQLVELVEASAPPPGSPLVQVKGDTTAHTAWTTATIAGDRYEVDLTSGGKGMSGGIEEAAWLNGTTLFTLTPQSQTPGGPPTPLSPVTIEEIATHLAPA